MDRAWEGAPNCQSYADDIFNHSPTLQEYLRNLERIFQRVDKTGISSARTNANWEHEFLEVLGYIISKEGRRPVYGYLDKLRTFHIPKNTKELQRFIGTANYYLCYIENISSRKKPLYSLLRRGKGWEWDQQCQEALFLLSWNPCWQS